MAEEVKPNAEASAPAAGEVKDLKVDAKPIEKAAEAKPSDSSVKAEAKESVEQKPVVPEKYDLKLPKDALLDASAIEKIAAYAKEQGLSNESAQKLLERENQTVSEYVNEQKSKHKQINDTVWKNELVADKEFGGQHLEENGKLAHRAAEAFFGESFIDEVKALGMNHNPILFKGLVRIAKAMSDDRLVIPGAQAGGSQNDPKKWFDHPSSKTT